MALDIAKLKPTSESSDEIASALDRIAGARAETEKDLTRTRAHLEHLMTEGSIKEIRGAEQKVADLSLEIQRLDLLLAKVRPTLQQAHERERAAAHDAAVAALEAEIEPANARWDGELAEHIRAVTELVEERKQLAQRARVLGLHHHATALLQGTEWMPATNEQMRREQKEAEHLAQTEANEREYERRMTARREWQERSRQIDERRRAAEADAERRGLRELPSPVRIVNG